MAAFVDFVLHLDTHLLDLIQAYGPWVYGLLFAIVFAETGLVVTPFLPGDSLLFATGAVAAKGALNPWLAAGLLVVAAVAGDAVNYAVGRTIGPKVFRATDTRGWSHKLLNREHLHRAHVFFEKHGGKAVVLCRFMPVLRTFVPFVAGAGRMTYPTFVFYNVIGAVAWVTLCLGAGVLWGNVPFVKEHFSLVTLGIVVVSILPIAFELLRKRAPRPYPQPE